MKFLLVCIFVGQISFHAQAKDPLFVTAEDICTRDETTRGGSTKSEQFEKARENKKLNAMEPRIRAALLRANLNIEDYELSYEVTEIGRDYYLTSKSEICKFIQGYHIEMYGAISAPELDSVECYVK